MEIQGDIMEWRDLTEDQKKYLIQVFQDKYFVFRNNYFNKISFLKEQICFCTPLAALQYSIESILYTYP